jgi:hypothetical protein
VTTTGRGRLTWVTALTVACLLLGSGAINVLAEGRNGHGDGGQGKAEHAQTISAQPGGGNGQAKHDSQGASQSAVVQTTTNTSAGHANSDHGNANGNSDHATGNGGSNVTAGTGSSSTQGADKHNDNADVQRSDSDTDSDDEDLVTPPSQVTKETRPGLGCGDDNHIHTGPPGNPGKVCKKDADDSSGAMDADDSASAQQEVASVDDEVASADDDSSGD